MNLPVFLICILFLGLISFVIGSRGNKGNKTQDDYFLMNRQLTPLALMMTLLATQIGGGSLLGAAEEAYARGWLVLLYPLGMVLGMLVLGLGFGAKVRRLNLSTIVELFETKYGSITLRKIASCLSVTSLFFILVAQAIAAKKFFLAIGFSGPTLFVLFWAILVSYTVIGGLRAVIKTDILQTSFILIAFVIASLLTVKRGFTSQAAVMVVPSSLPWSSWLLMPFLFMLIEQDMGQRCFAAKTPKTVTKAAIMAAGILFLTSLVPIAMGTMAAREGLIIPSGESVLITAVTTFTGPTVAALVMGAIFMAIISTADSLLCSISSNIASDFPLFRNKKLAFAKGITFVVGMATLGLCFLFNNVIAMLMFSYELSVSVLFVPLMMALFDKAPQKQAAAWSMIVGALCFLAQRQLVSPNFPKEIVTLALSYGVYQGVSALTKSNAFYGYLKSQKLKHIIADGNKAARKSAKNEMEPPK